MTCPNCKTECFGETSITTYCDDCVKKETGIVMKEWLEQKPDCLSCVRMGTRLCKACTNKSRYEEAKK